MTIIRTEQPLTYPERHDHQHAGRVAWWLRDRESWGCVFERGPAAEPAPGVDSGSGKPESLGLPDSCLDKTHFPAADFGPFPTDFRSLTEFLCGAQITSEHEQATTLAITPSGAFWRTQDASGAYADAPVASDLTEALEALTERLPP